MLSPVHILGARWIFLGMFAIAPASTGCTLTQSLDGYEGPANATPSDGSALDASMADQGVDTAAWPSPCETGEGKTCGATCAALDDPNFGCGPTTCTPCSLPNATAGCAGDSCAIQECESGFGDCDNVPSNGCETPLGTLADCGSCGDACDAPNGTTSCRQGSCEMVSCPNWRADCDGLVANGCESDLTGTSNCGECENKCAPLFICNPYGGGYVCACTMDSACDAGYSGAACGYGVCSCDGFQTACPFGNRCTGPGRCG